MQIHGSFPYRECEKFDIDPAAIIDFSASVNPFPLPKAALKAFQQSNLRAYPDRENREFREIIVKEFQLRDEFLAPCAGTTAIIYSLPKLFKSMTILTPAYGDYLDACNQSNCSFVELPFDRFTVKTKIDTELLIIVNPSNPEGRYFEPEEIRAICTNNPTVEVIIDEAYQQLGEQCESVLASVNSLPNLSVLRSLTKSFAIAGLRAGYFYSNWAKKAEALLTPWAVSKPVQDMIPALFQSMIGVREQWQEILYDKKELITSISKLGYQIKSGRGPFFLLEVPNATSFRLRLLKEFHINVRDCRSFGLPNMIRIMPGTTANNEKLIKALKVLHE